MLNGRVSGREGRNQLPGFLLPTDRLAEQFAAHAGHRQWCRSSRLSFSIFAISSGLAILLIIEEPESHLHPAIQSVFARELARLVRSGVRVLLTTHSEWFLEQIGNLVRLSKLPEKRRSGIAGADVALRPDQVGAWLFTPKTRPKGTVVSEIKLDEETGLYPSGYDDVSEVLYNEGRGDIQPAAGGTH